MTQTITLYSCDIGVRAAIRNLFEGEAVEVFEVTDSTKFTRENINEQRQEGTIGRLNLPGNVDYVVTKSALNRKTEGLAATLALQQDRNDVLAVVLPEAIDFLRNQLDRRGSLVLVGSDQAK